MGCTLAEAQLRTSPAYEALSYVWGSRSPDTAKSIQLNGTTFPVGENLEAALRQLRPRPGTAKPRVMGVDAVYIDKSNVEERSQQVAQMDDVYRGAESVVVWLGRETSTSARTFETFHGVKAIAGQAVTRLLLASPMTLESPFGPVRDKCQGPHDPNRSLHKIYNSKTSPESEQLSAVDILKPVVKKALTLAPRLPQTIWTKAATELAEDSLKILSRPWWERVWVPQELVLAKEVVLRCGPKSLSTGKPPRPCSSPSSASGGGQTFTPQGPHPTAAGCLPPFFRASRDRPSRVSLLFPAGPLAAGRQDEGHLHGRAALADGAPQSHRPARQAVRADGPAAQGQRREGGRLQARPLDQPEAGVHAGREAPAGDHVEPRHHHGLGKSSRLSDFHATGRHGAEPASIGAAVVGSGLYLPSAYGVFVDMDQRLLSIQSHRRLRPLRRTTQMQMQMRTSRRSP